MRNLLFLGHLLDRQGDREGDANGDLCLSCARHLLRWGKRLTLFKIVEPSTITEASKTEKVRKNLYS